MSAKILDGKKVSEGILKVLALNVSKMSKKPTLAVVLLGGNGPSEIYVKQKEKAAKRIGVGFQLIRGSSNISQDRFEKIIEKSNKDKNITGIVIQKPLPPQIDSDEIDCLVAQEKDVDGLNPVSPFIPSITRGVLELLSHYKIKIEGKKVVVLGRSKLAGLPTALEFLNQNATVTICHSETKNLKEETKTADILVSIVGKEKLVGAGMVKQKAVVVDVGVNRIKTKEGKTRVMGDVDFKNVSKVASFITPVPGGVGPMTVAALLENLVEASS